MPEMNQQGKSIKDSIIDYLEYLELEKGLSSKSQENYAKFLRKFLYFLDSNDLVDLKPGDLTTDHIWKYRVFLSRQRNPQTKELLKRSTQNHYLVALRSLLDFYVERDIPSLPPNKVKIPKNTDEQVIHFLSLDQVNKLLESPNTAELTGLRDRAIIETLFSTGLRVAELVSLNREQVVINAETTDLEIVVVGKGNKPRPVFFSSSVVTWLKRYLSTRNDTEKALFISYSGPTPNTRLTTRSMERIVKYHALRAGLPSITHVHSLRHSFATDLLNKGADLRVVQEFLGHRNIATTQLYTHVTTPQLREIHRKLHGKKNE